MHTNGLLLGCDVRKAMVTLKHRLQGFARFEEELVRQPDVVVLSSAFWDLARWVEHYPSLVAANSLDQTVLAAWAQQLSDVMQLVEVSPVQSQENFECPSVLIAPLCFSNLAGITALRWKRSLTLIEQNCKAHPVFLGTPAQPSLLVNLHATPQMWLKARPVRQRPASPHKHFQVSPSCRWLHKRAACLIETHLLINANASLCSLDTYPTAAGRQIIGPACNLRRQWPRLL